MSDALKAFQAMRADVEQFDDHEPEGDSGLFSERVPPYMRSYLVNWLRRFMAEHGDEVEAALGAQRDMLAHGLGVMRVTGDTAQHVPLADFLADKPKD